MDILCGILYLDEGEEIYIYVGGRGDTVQTGITPGGFNGGGTGGNMQYTGGGGGASDMRIGTDSLFSRVIVAGGRRRSRFEPWRRF